MDKTGLMDSSTTSKRKLLPFVPDVPYHIQLVFVVTFGYIWYSALTDDYLADLPEDPEAAYLITVSSPTIFIILTSSIFILEKQLVERNYFMYFVPVCILVFGTISLGLLRSNSEILENHLHARTDLLLRHYHFDES